MHHNHEGRSKTKTVSGALNSRTIFFCFKSTKIPEIHINRRVLKRCLRIMLSIKVLLPVKRTHSRPGCSLETAARMTIYRRFKNEYLKNEIIPGHLDHTKAKIGDFPFRKTSNL